MTKTRFVPALLLPAIVALYGCANLDALQAPATPGEIATGSTYVPVDPLPVTRADYSRCKAMKKDPNKRGVMDALPDTAVRMAMREISATADAGFGPIVIGAAGNAYQVIVDSVVSDTTNVRFAIKVGGGEGSSLFALPRTLAPGAQVAVFRLGPGEAASEGFEEVTIPVYVGVGLRLTANLVVRAGHVNLSNLPAVAASAEARKASGSLTMQALGLYSQQVASTFPIPSELNTTTIQNALLSLGAVKAIIYDSDTGSRPRVTGFFNPLPTSDPKLINKIYSALAAAPVPSVPCENS